MFFLLTLPFRLLFGVLVLVAGLLVHTLLDLATVCYLLGGISRTAWAATIVVTMCVFGWGAQRAGLRLGVVIRVATT